MARSRLVTTDPNEHEWMSVICTCCGYSKKVPVRCANRYCSICRGSDQRKRVATVEYAFKNARPPHDARWTFLTLTLPNSSDCGLMIKQIRAAFKRLRSRPSWKKVWGGWYAIEVKRSQRNADLWHVHIHAIILKTWVNIKQLQKDWQLCNSDWKYDGVWSKHLHWMVCPPHHSLRYIVAYTQKASLTLGEQQDLMDVLWGVNMWAAFGLANQWMKGFKMQPSKCTVCGIGDWYPEDVFAYRYPEDWAYLHSQWDNARLLECSRASPCPGLSPLPLRNP